MPSAMDHKTAKKKKKHFTFTYSILKLTLTHVLGSLLIILKIKKGEKGYRVTLYWPLTVQLTSSDWSVDLMFEFDFDVCLGALRSAFMIN
jgi:hypothetical protein